MRRGGVLAGLLLLLVAMVALSGLTVEVVGRTLVELPGLTDDWHYVLSAAPGEIMYVATFDGFLDDWDSYDDGRLSAQVQESALRLVSETPDRMPFSVTQQRFGDFDLRVDTTVIDGPLDNAFGVMFRMKDAENFYQFSISSDGFYRIVRKVNNDEREISTWIATPHINQGIDVGNRLRLIANGNRFQFFINGNPIQLCIPNNPEGSSTFFSEECLDGQMVDTLVDDSLSSGQLGLAIQTFTEPGVIVAFDNAIVYGVGANE